MNVFLVGISGSGKSSVGKLLAKRLGLKDVDTDRLIEKKAEKTIAEIFRVKGEGAFREMEKEMVTSLSRKEGLVVALGGGAVIIPEVRELLKKKLLCGLELIPGRRAGA